MKVDPSKVGKNVDFQGQGDTLLDDTMSLLPHFYRVTLAFDFNQEDQFGNTHRPLEIIDVRFASWGETLQEILEDLAKFRAEEVTKAHVVRLQESLANGPEVTLDALQSLLWSIPVQVLNVEPITDPDVLLVLKDAKAILQNPVKVPPRGREADERELYMRIQKAGKNMLRAPAVNPDEITGLRLLISEYEVEYVLASH